MLLVARIRADKHAVLLPAESAYDREIVFEEAAFFARQHGTADLQIGRTSLHASSSDPQAAPCEHCGHPARLVSYLVRHQRLCTDCAKHSIR